VTAARPHAAAMQPLAQAFPVVLGWLAGGGEAGAEPPRTAACDLAERFGLDGFARNVLLLCACVALEPEAQIAVARQLGGPAQGLPTVGLALALVPGAHWQAFAADAPLRRSGLVRLESGAGGLAHARIGLAEPVLLRLLGAMGLDDSVAPILRAVPLPDRLAPNRDRLAQAISARMRLPGNPVLHLLGPDPEGKLLAFARAAAGHGRATYALNAQVLPASPVELLALATTMARDMALAGAEIVVMQDDQADSRPTQLFAELYQGPLAVTSTEAIRVGGRVALRLELTPPTAAEQLGVWQEALGARARTLEPALGRLAATFRIAPEAAQAIALDLQASPDADNETLARATWAACRQAARPRMDDLARRVESPVTWDDLVLPARQKETLASIIAQIRNRARVYEDWGFAPRLQNKGLGVSALFSGPSGAGKSMAGELIGATLELDVYRVDLSALVSKWVGETEKNLRRVFDAAEDGGVILQFDEADALFGRRSEVKDSHDRHANIEVSYLLQRLEAYRGLCILTTNMKDNIDEAFLRRLSFMVEFRFPGRAERRAIWERVFPQGLPLGTLDFDRLAQLNVSGGSIRNIALGAAFLAADRGSKVTMAQILTAAALEYEKLGRPMTDAERVGWLG
jgi:AAA+ superfamily predicted ATPase